MSCFWQNTDIFTCIQICYYDWPSFNKWFVIANIGHVFATRMCQHHVTQCSSMEISAYCRWPDLSWPLCDRCRNQSDLWPCFLPRKLFQTVQDWIAASGARFLTYTLPYIPCLSFSCGCVRALYSTFEYLLHNMKATGKQGQKLISLSIM